MTKSLVLNTCRTQESHDRPSEVRAVEATHSEADDSGIRPSPIVTARQAQAMTLKDRLLLARQRLLHAAENGIRIRVYEVALDLDMSEFHFARQFRATFGCSPHVFYDEMRAARARSLLREGHPQGHVARRIGLRRPAELRALLTRRNGVIPAS